MRTDFRAGFCISDSVNGLPKAEQPPLLSENDNKSMITEHDTNNSKGSSSSIINDSDFQQKPKVFRLPILPRVTARRIVLLIAVCILLVLLDILLHRKNAAYGICKLRLTLFDGQQQHSSSGAKLVQFISLMASSLPSQQLLR